MNSLTTTSNDECCVCLETQINLSSRVVCSKCDVFVCRTCFTDMTSTAISLNPVSEIFELKEYVEGKKVKRKIESY
jgi:hypothetical protein